MRLGRDSWPAQSQATWNCMARHQLRVTSCLRWNRCGILQGPHSQTLKKGMSLKGTRLLIQKACNIGVTHRITSQSQKWEAALKTVHSSHITIQGYCQVSESSYPWRSCRGKSIIWLRWQEVDRGIPKMNTIAASNQSTGIVVTNCNKMYLKKGGPSSLATDWTAQASSLRSLLWRIPPWRLRGWTWAIRWSAIARSKRCRVTVLLNDFRPQIKKSKMLWLESTLRSSISQLM